MAWSWKFDPTTLDLVPDGKGSFQRTDQADSAVMHQLLCHYAKFWGAPEFGSKLYDLNAFQRDPKTLAALEAKRALGRLVDRGRIANLEVTSDATRGRVVVATRFRDASTGQLVDTFVKSGG